MTDVVTGAIEAAGEVSETTVKESERDSFGIGKWDEDAIHKL